jgi:hypothetical protein
VTPRMPSKPPQRLALLPDREAVRHLTTAVLQEGEDLPQAALSKVCVPFADDARWDADPIRDLVDEAMERFADSPTGADAWLAPRLHATLRITRREAADASLWNFLAMRLAPDYVFWRHPPRASKKHPVPQVNPARFIGAYHSQTFARLWWAAELFRNGADYRPVEIACGNQDVLNTVLRLEIIYHRATAQALVRLLERGTVRTGRHVNALAQAVNAAGSTLFFEVLAPDGMQDADAYRGWIEAGGTAFVQFDSLPDGPADGAAPNTAVDALLPLFEKLFAEAPGRAQTPATEGP